MWTCPRCRRSIDPTMEVCWACGTTRDGVVDPTFQPVEDTPSDGGPALDDLPAAVLFAEPTPGRVPDEGMREHIRNCRLLVFPVTELPELPRGKGNKIFGIPPKKAATGEEALVAIAAVAPGQTLRVLSGERHMGLSYRELGDYRGERGQRGAVLPRGWRKVDGLEVE